MRLFIKTQVHITQFTNQLSVDKVNYKTLAEANTWQNYDWGWKKNIGDGNEGDQRHYIKVLKLFEKVCVADCLQSATGQPF